MTVCKFNDQNNDRAQGADEPLLPHWPISALVDGGVVNAQTDDKGCITFSSKTFSPTSTIVLTEGTVGHDWTQTAPFGTCDFRSHKGQLSGSAACSVDNNGAITVTIAAGDDVAVPNFGNYNATCAVQCSGDTLVVTKTATPAYTKTFTWGITKAADKTSVTVGPVSPTAGEAVTANYTVIVTHDAGTDSAWTVTGNITVSNPTTVAATVNVSDAVDNGGTCEVPGGTAVAIEPGTHVVLPYTCTYSTAPTSAAGLNTATAQAPAGNYSGTATFDFTGATATVVDGSVSVTDTLGGALGTVTSADTAKTYTYSKTFSDTPGSCHQHPNTATLKTNSLGTEISAVKNVEVCVLGGDMPQTSSFTRSYTWSVGKVVVGDAIKYSSSAATFNYSVAAAETGVADSAFAVVGTPGVQIVNPSALAITVTPGAMSAGCTFTSAAPQSIPAGGTGTFGFGCSYLTNPSPLTISASFTFTDGINSGNLSGFENVTFDIPNVVNNPTVTVKDAFNGGLAVTLGSLTATDKPGALAPVSATYTYSQTVDAPMKKVNCLTFLNTASLYETAQSSSASVQSCGAWTAGDATIGFWQNKNGQALITGGASEAGACKSATYLRQFAPFQELSATANCAAVGTYATNLIKAASASGAAMNAMLKAQMLGTALATFFSDPALGTNKLSMPVALGGVKIDLTRVCTPAGTCASLANAGLAFGGATSMKVSDILVYAASQSNVSASAWYGQVKTTQELAKNVFDAINNTVAYLAP